MLLEADIDGTAAHAEADGKTHLSASRAAQQRVIWIVSTVRLFLVFAASSAIIFCLSKQAWGNDHSSKMPGRQAQCLLEVEGEDYLKGECLFTPLDQKGSFKITADKHLGALVKVVSSGKADVSWSGEAGGDAMAISLGSASYNDSGCWIIAPSTDFSQRTLVCAWDKNERLFLGPTPTEPSPPTLGWGESAGMYAQITSSEGLNTENAKITAKKDKNGAIIWCRLDYDYSMKCIEDLLKDGRFAAARMTLHANCKTKRFTDFWGRSLNVFNSDIIDQNTGEKVDSDAAGLTVASSAFKALCPEQAKKLRNE